MKKRICSIAMSLVFALSFLPGLAAPVSAAPSFSGSPDVTVADETDLNSEISGAGGPLWIQLGSGFQGPLASLTGTVDIPAGKQIKITGGTLRGTNAFSIVTVQTGAYLETEDVTITGGYNADSGGGVRILGTGEFVMKSGSKIRENEARWGGGVYVDYNASFTMNGGEISDNISNTGNGGGVYNNGRFTMEGGKISGNRVNSGSGGGVFVNWDAFFTMERGEISDNRAGGTNPNDSNGGGIYSVRIYSSCQNIVNWNDSIVIKSGAVFSGNEAYGLRKMTEDHQALYDAIVEPGATFSFPSSSGYNGFNNFDIGYLEGTPVYYPPVYTVIFDPNGGTGTMDAVAVGAASPAGSPPYTLALPPNQFTRTGYTFGGWIADDAANTPYGDADTLTDITGDVKLTAQWTRDTGSVTVRKHVDGAIPASGTFTVTLTPLEGGASFTFTLSTPDWTHTQALPTGVYEVAETDIPAGYGTDPAFSGSGYGAGRLTVESGAQTLTVSNAAAGGGDGEDENGGGEDEDEDKGESITEDGTGISAPDPEPAAPPESSPGTQPEEPAVTEPEIPPAPGGNDPARPPAPIEWGNGIVPGENGVYIEINEDGVPLGEWHWEEPIQEWVFEEYPPPLADMTLPQTGGQRAPLIPLLGFLAIVSIVAAVLLPRMRYKGKHS